MLIDILESVIKALLESATTGQIALFFAGIIFCLWSLAFYLRFFEKWDDLLDTLHRVVELLDKIENNQKAKKIRDMIARGEDVTEEL